MSDKLLPVGERRSSAAGQDLASWRLVVSGLVERPLTLSLQDLGALPRAERLVDIHCVTGWSRRHTRLEGYPLSALLERAGPLPEARFVRFEAYSDRGHDTSLPLDLALEDTWLVDTIDGTRLAERHGGPLRTVTPSRWFYKSLKWVHRVELMAADRLGFWERESGYRNEADPWAPTPNRFVHGDVFPGDLKRLQEGRSLGRLRGQVLIGLDLRAWDPAERDLRQLALKACDLREAKLAGVDLREANLTRSDLRGADLSGADLRGADLEGANLVGADLRRARLDGALLTVASFVSEEGAALVEGMTWAEASGLLPSDEAFLKSAG